MTFQPERLIFARKRRQITQTDLARTLGIVPKTIQRYEHGQEVPKDERLAQLASTLGFPAEFFLDSRPLPEIPAPALSFRAYSKLKARVRDNAVAVAQLSVGIEAMLTEHFELPELEVPDVREEASSPVHAAQIVRSTWALGSGPISNMVHLLEAKGVRLFSLAEDAKDVDAFCFWHDAKPFVVLNRAKSAERGRFDAAHELGHLAMHRHIDFRNRDVEREADQFAGEFLVPAASLETQIPSLITLETVKKLKKFWSVSAMAMVRRLKDIGKLTDWNYRSMCIDLASAGYRTHEVDGMPTNETSSLLAGMISSEGVTIAELSRGLHVRAADLSPLVFDLPHARGPLRLVRSA